jgi:GTP cyclohydrolase I
MEKIKKANDNIPRTAKEKEKMIIEASKHYEKFLEAMGYDPQADPQTQQTSLRVAKAWMNDLIIGSLTEEPSMTAFPNEENYDGVVIQTGIPVVSMCAHHNLPFTGYASIAYIPRYNVIGLSKLNRVVDWFSRRPQMQESLTQQIHTFLSEKLKCESVAVSISSKHMCCGNRGIKHPTSVMTTNKFSGAFMEPGNLIREEFLHAISKNGKDL